MDIVSIDKLTFRYNDKFIFDKFSLSIKKGSFVCITGPNGSGKSTLIKIISGLIPTNLSVRVCGNDVRNYNVRKKIGVVFSDIDDMFLCETVEDDIIFVLENLCYSRKEIRRRVIEISNEFGINHLLNMNPSMLSGGEKIKAALAISLVNDPELLLLDESLPMIDENDKKNVLSILKKRQEKGLTIISVIHDLRESFDADRLIVLNDGEIVLDGAPIKVMEYDKVLNRLGIEIPFEIDLCIKLKLYGIIDNLIPSMNKLVNTLWE